MKLTHIISTMNKRSADFLLPMEIREGATVVNQADFSDDAVFELGEVSARMISTEERGLSRSRNMLLDCCEGDIAILGDDDLIYLSDYTQKIEQAYLDYPDADIIAFSFTESKEENTRRQFKSAKRLNLFGISKIASVEITFKIDRIREKGLRFDTLLGLGAEFGSGEENAFLADALRRGLKIYYVPKTIVYLIPTEGERAKWQGGFDEDYFTKKGACFHRIYGRLFLAFAFAFILLKKRGIFKDVKLLSAFKWMKNGRRKYKELKNKCS